MITFIEGFIMVVLGGLLLLAVVMLVSVMIWTAIEMFKEFWHGC